MKYGIIIGSHRASSQSAKVSKYIKGYLSHFDTATTVYELDLSSKPLPFWDEGVWNDDPSWKKIWEPIATELKSCDAFVIVSPEYHGMVPAALKNFFLLASKNELGHKPGLIVAISSGRGGAYPVAELRMSSYKNSRINWIPDHMIVRNAEQVLNSDASASEDDKLTRARLDYCLRVLREYGKALKLVRDSGVIDYVNHPNGL